MLIHTFYLILHFGEPVANSNDLIRRFHQFKIHTQSLAHKIAMFWHIRFNSVGNRKSLKHTKFIPKFTEISEFKL